MTKTRIEELIDLLNALEVVCGINSSVKSTLQQHVDFDDMIGELIAEAQNIANDIKMKDIAPF